SSQGALEMPKRRAVRTYAIIGAEIIVRRWAQRGADTNRSAAESGLELFGLDYSRLSCILEANLLSPLERSQCIDELTLPNKRIAQMNMIDGGVRIEFNRLA